MTDNPPSLELIVYKLDELGKKVDHLTDEKKEAHDALSKRVDSLEAKLWAFLIIPLAPITGWTVIKALEIVVR